MHTYIYYYRQQQASEEAPQHVVGVCMYMPDVLPNTDCHQLFSFVMLFIAQECVWIVGDNTVLA
eukprot:scaffold430985_cov51-Prasinocladus_malaysianus.AAC.1